MKLNQIVYLFALASLLIMGQFVQAGVLPEERLDLMVHSYDGGGIEVNGPALLVRKDVTTNSSVFYKYYVDNITSASIDVELGGSKYDEHRTEHSAGIDYLNGKTTMNLSITGSKENDYKAGTLDVGISQDFFGDLSTVTMGYSYGEDSVSKRIGNNPLTFSGELSSITRQNYRVGLSQILTKNASIAFAWETITDEATEINGSGVTLNNPYRSYSYGTVGVERFFAQEKYPSTRTSNAFSLRGNYYLTAFKSAIHYEYRWFQDSWGIKANNLGLHYVYPLKMVTLDFRWRYYSQGKADFYRDMFDYQDQYDFMARDKELSAYTSTSVGLAASYIFAKNGWGWIDKGSLNLSYDTLSIEYDNFRDARQSQNDPSLAGLESRYTLNADIIQAYLSIWF